MGAGDEQVAEAALAELTQVSNNVDRVLANNSMERIKGALKNRTHFTMLGV